MAATTETARDLEFLISEAPGSLSRELVTVASGAGALVAGTVLGKITSGGKYTVYDDDNNDGSETAVGILTHAVDATSADQKASIIVRLAEVSNAKVVWGANNDADDKTAGKADLAATYVIFR